MQKKILIRAYVNINLGDDIFIKMLCERYPNHQFYLLGTKIKTKPFNHIKNLKIINSIRYIDTFLDKFKIKLKLNKVLEDYLLRKCDAVFNVGGSIFIEPEKNWNKKTDSFENFVDSSKHFFVLGSNFGPYSDSNYFKRYHEIFKKIDDICFRDEYSYNKFSDLPNTRLAPDIVFSLDPTNIAEFIEDEYVVVSVMDLSWRKDLKEYTELYEKSIADISKRLISMNMKVILMSFCADEGDEKAINRILARYPNRNMSSYSYNGDLSESLSVLKSSSGIIATRFHSLILGWVFNKPVFPFEYSKKTTNLLRDIKFDGYHLPIDDILNIDIEKIVNQIIKRDIQDISQEKNAAEKHFSKTDDFLNKFITN